MLPEQQNNPGVPARQQHINIKLQHPNQLQSEQKPAESVKAPAKAAKTPKIFCFTIGGEFIGHLNIIFQSHYIYIYIYIMEK